MTFYEKIMQAAKEQGIENINQLANASGIPYNALRSLKEKNKPLSESHKMLLTKAIKRNMGEIQKMVTEARAEELAESSPTMAKKIKTEPIHIVEEESIGEVEPVVTEETSAPEPNEDNVLDEKIEKIKAEASVLLTYHDRIKEVAEEALATEYAAMLRNRMLDVAISDLAELCGQFTQAPDPNKAVEFREIASEIIKLKEE